MHFMGWAVQARMVYGPQFHFRPSIILAWIAESVNLHMHPKAKFYLLNTFCPVITIFFIETHDVLNAG